MKEELHPRLTVRLFTDRKCFGPGVAELLHHVEAQHSLRAAAGAMEMAYSTTRHIRGNLIVMTPIECHETKFKKAT